MTVTTPDPSPIPKRELLPKRLGRYDVRAKIGEGGMASVYVGRDGDRVVALKVIKEEYSLNREFVNMFLDEAKIVSKLKHPNLIEVYELGNEGARLFIAMQLLAGQSLWHVWMACRDRGVRLRYETIAWIGARIAEGLHYAHELRDAKGKPLGVVHRDVNASNIFVTYDGQVKVIDFGLAKAANRVSRTAAGVVKGKFAYMSPEQALGKPIDRRTDLFALAATLWELSVDRRLFKGKDDFETLRRVSQARVRDPVSLAEGYPPELSRVLRKALARDRTQRYTTALELAAALDAFATGQTTAPGAPAEGQARAIGEAFMAEVMRALFEHELVRETRWIAEASAADLPAPRESLKPPAPLGTDRASVEDEPRPSGPRSSPVGGIRASSSAPSEPLFAPPAVRPLGGPEGDAPEPSGVTDDPPLDDDDAPKRTWSVRRAVLFTVLILVIMALAMAVGAWWGRHG